MKKYICNFKSCTERCMHNFPHKHDSDCDFDYCHTQYLINNRKNVKVHKCVEVKK